MIGNYYPYKMPPSEMPVFLLHPCSGNVLKRTIKTPKRISMIPPCQLSDAPAAGTAGSSVTALNESGRPETKAPIAAVRFHTVWLIIYHSLMAYKIASRMFFNNSAESVSYS